MERKFPRVISADSHVMEPMDLWSNALGNKFGDRTPRIVDEFLGQKGRFFYTGWTAHKLSADIAEGTADPGLLGRDPQARLGFQEEAGIEAEVMNPTRMVHIMINPKPSDWEMVRSCVEVYHDWASEFCSAQPERLRGVALIPVVVDVDWAVQELERVAKKGLRSLLIKWEAEGKVPLRDRIYDPIWARAQEMDIPITLHINGGSALDPFHIHDPEELSPPDDAPRQMLGLFSEVQTVLANEFIFGTILDRFPRLKLVSAEYEISWIPYFQFRMDQMQEDFAGRMPLPKLRMRASDYMRTQVYHGFIDDPNAMSALPSVGVDQVVWGSDFPHIRAVGLEAHDHLATVLRDLPKADQEKIAGRNSAKVFGL